nr:ThiF family adenylyltransferase [Rhodomicrobium sp. Az07]
MAQRYRLSRLSVNRIEQAKSRRPAYLSNELLTKTVCVIGCGSLGSGVAKLLLQSGVGSLKLIDPEVMTWANTERHELGAASVGKNKAQELANHFSRNYPLCGGVIAYKNQWQEVLRAEPEMFGKADLVLSTCANWNAECALNDAHRAGQFSGPVLYGWLEDYAIAGHALAIGGGGTCLRCGFSKTGEVLVPVSRSAPPHVPGCGGGASPYGAIDMAPTQAMIASLALDLLLGRASAPVYRVSISPKATFASADADYSFEWLSQYGEPPCGGTITAGFWRQNENCVCHS